MTELYYPLYSGDNTDPANCTGTPIRYMTFTISSETKSRYESDKSIKRKYTVTSDSDFDCWGLGWCCIGSNRSGEFIHEIEGTALSKCVTTKHFSNNCV